VRLSIRTHLLYTSAQPCDLLLQIEASSDAVQSCRETRLILDPQAVHHETAGEEGIGIRRWVTSGPRFECHYETVVEVKRPQVDFEALAETPRTQIPGDVINYLMPSRYCHSDLFLDFVQGQFGHLTGGALVSAMSIWIKQNFTYDNGASNAATTATDSFASLAGVCRDYAHMLITFARAAGIPARFVSAYAPDVVPQDFHAVVEVYLDDGWHLIDPTYMAKASETARICIGRDAADASFLTSYGWMDLQEQTVEVRRLSR
jgi:transglutaminase-like putative cysteine protease